MRAAAAGIGAAPGSPAVDAFAADMSVPAGVRRLAARVLDSYPRLDVLVNSVGGFWAHRQFGEVCAELERGVHGNLALFGRARGTAGLAW